MQTSGFLHQTRQSDGEIYWILRCYYYRCGKNTDPPWTQLSPCKDKHLNMLTRILTDKGPPRYKHQGILNALDSVVSLPALRCGMLLGNWHKILKLGCPEPVIHYFTHIRKQWAAIAKDVPAFCADSGDVKNLEFLAPSIPEDRSQICRMMKGHLIFRDVNDLASRKKILRNILSIEGIITSLKTFHTNINYLEVALDILREYIMEDGETEHHTLFQNLAAHWDHRKAVVEHKEGHFHRLDTTHFKIAVVQLILFILRHFPYLSNVQPLQDKRGVRAVVAEVDDYFLFLLYTLAHKLGFSTSKIHRGVNQRCVPSRPRKFVVNKYHRKWRGGKPPMRAFLDLETDSFLPKLLTVPRDRDSSLFVQADFITAFFGGISYVQAEEITPGSRFTSPSQSWHTATAHGEQSPSNVSESERHFTTRWDSTDGSGASPIASHSPDTAVYPTLPSILNESIPSREQAPYNPPPSPIPPREPPTSPLLTQSREQAPYHPPLSTNSQLNQSREQALHSPPWWERYLKLQQQTSCAPLPRPPSATHPSPPPTNPPKGPPTISQTSQSREQAPHRSPPSTSSQLNQSREQAPYNPPPSPSPPRDPPTSPLLTQSREQAPYHPPLSTSSQLNQSREQAPYNPLPSPHPPKEPPTSPQPGQSRERAPHRPPLSTQPTQSSQSLHPPYSISSSSSPSSRGPTYNPISQSKPLFKIPQLIPLVPSKRSSPEAESPTKRQKRYQSQLSDLDNQTADNEQLPYSPPNFVAETSARGRDLTGQRHVRTNDVSSQANTQPSNVRPREGINHLRDEYIHQQKTMWQRHFLQARGGSDPPSMESFLAEQGQIFDAYGKNHEELLKSTFISEQEKIYNQFRNFRQVDPGPDHGQLPDRPSSREEFLALQEDLYQQYPSLRPKLLKKEKRLSGSSGSSTTEEEAPKEAIDPWAYRDPHKKC